jgi:methanogenic corrinoid protein MtbC1
MSEYNGKLVQAMADLEEDQFHSLFETALSSGEDALALLETCRKGMDIVGKRYQEKDYFLTDLIMAAEMFKTAVAQLEPQLSGFETQEPAGTIVFGTVKGDIHDIGKDIVIAMLRGAGFTVHDMGVDVEPQAFVDKVRETGANIVGLTGLITMSYDGMKDTVTALEAAGLRSHIKIMVGGGMVNEKVLEYTGADAWGDDVTAAIALARKFSGNLMEAV